MTNQELFEQYNTEKWVIEQNLCFMLQEYWEKYGKTVIEQAKNGYTTSDMPYNPVSFVKTFMKEETECDIEYAEKSKMNTLENNEVETIDVDYMELS